MSEFPQKEFYKLKEVCEYTDTQPYVLRFWESEFPQLKPEKSRGGQSVYTREDIDLVRRIKQLLYEEECTLEDARQSLEGDARSKPGSSAGRKVQRKSREESGSSAATALRRASAPAKRVEDAPPAIPFKTPEDEMVSRQRYDGAVEEIAHLRLQLNEAEKIRREAEAATREADARGERERQRAVNATQRIEKLLDALS